MLRPGGLLLLEHVRSPQWAVRLAQRASAPLFLLLGRDHITREPLEHLPAAGFVVERLEGSKLGIVERLAARKPAEPPGRFEALKEGSTCCGYERR